MFVFVFVYLSLYLFVFEEVIRRWHRSLLNPNLDKDHEHVHREQTRFCILTCVCILICVFVFVFVSISKKLYELRRVVDYDHEHVHREQTRFCIWFQSRANMAYQIWPVKWVSITEKTKQKERDRFKYLQRWLYRAVSFFLFNPAHILNFNETHTISSSSWNQMLRAEKGTHVHPWLLFRVYFYLLLLLLCSIPMISKTQKIEDFNKNLVTAFI